MSTLKVNTIQNASGVEKYLCQAWVNFNGTGTVAIRASGNVSHITDNGTGNYTVNFTNALADTSFVVTTNVGDSGAGNALNAIYVISRTTSSVQVYLGSGSIATAYDASVVMVSIVR